MEKKVLDEIMLKNTEKLLDSNKRTGTFIFEEANENSSPQTFEEDRRGDRSFDIDAQDELIELAKDKRILENLISYFKKQLNDFTNEDHPAIMQEVKREQNKTEITNICYEQCRKIDYLIQYSVDEFNKEKRFEHRDPALKEYLKEVQDRIENLQNEKSVIMKRFYKLYPEKKG